MKVKLLPLIVFLMVYLGNASYPAAQVMKVGEVFDFRVGDEMGIFRAINLAADEWKFMKITGRKDFANDSMIISFHIATYTWNYQIYEWEKKHFDKTITYYDLDSPYFEKFPARDTVIYKYDINDTIRKQHIYKYQSRDSIYFDSCNTLVNWREWHVSTLLSGGSGSIKKAYRGLGLLEYFTDYDGANGTEYNEEFIYYIKNKKLCGTKAGFPVSLNEIPALKHFSVYPNPASLEIYIDCDQPFEIRMFSATGQLVLNKNLQPGSGIDISDFSEGFNFIEIVSEEINHKTKLFKL